METRINRKDGHITSVVFRDKAGNVVYVREDILGNMEVDVRIKKGDLKK